MMMYSRAVTCGKPGCGELAEYKVAAPWSAGKFSELKTYAIACAGHFADLYRESMGRRKEHPPSPEEIQGEIACFHFEKGKANQPLTTVPKPS